MSVTVCFYFGGKGGYVDIANMQTVLNREQNDSHRKADNKHVYQFVTYLFSKPLKKISNNRT